MAKLKLKLEERKRALDLLADGHSVESAAAHLHGAFHPELSFEVVKKTYFPPTGFGAISSLEGKSRNEIEARYKQMLSSSRKIGKAGKATLKKLFKNPRFTEANRRRAVERNKKLSQDPGFRQRHADRNRAKWRAYFADPELRKAHSARSSKLLTALHANPTFAAAHAERVKKRTIKLWQNPVLRAKLTEQARRTMAMLQGDLSFRLRHVERMKRMWRDPVYAAEQAAAASKRMLESWRNPHYRILQRAWSNLRTHRRKLERAVNFLEVQQPGGWDVATGAKQSTRQRVAVHVPQMEDAIDRARAMRKMLGVLPARQRVLLSHFFDINLQHSQQAVKEAQALTAAEVEAELKAAMETLRQSAAWKKLLDE